MRMRIVCIQHGTPRICRKYVTFHESHYQQLHFRGTNDAAVGIILVLRCLDPRILGELLITIKHLSI